MTVPLDDLSVRGGVRTGEPGLSCGGFWKGFSPPLAVVVLVVSPPPGEAVWERGVDGGGGCEGPS